MIYVDTSVVLATLLSEDRAAPPTFWQQPLVSSRLLAVESWVRVHGKRLARSHGELLGTLLGRVALVELDPRVLVRTNEPFPSAVRTLDAIHLATVHYLQAQGQPLQLATFDERMAVVAKQMKMPMFDFADA